MTLSDLFEQQQQVSIYHIAEHHSNTTNLTTTDHSCHICYPPPQYLPPAFQNFWNWINTYWHAISYTSYTVQALPVFCQAFQQDTNNYKGHQVVLLLRDLLFSIRYSQRPDPITDLVFYLFNFTYRTNKFDNPVTPEIINQLDQQVQNARQNNPNFNNFLNNPSANNNPPNNQQPNPPNNQPNNQNNLPMADEAAITAALTAVFGQNAGNLMGRGSNIAKVEPFYGKEDEDPIEWLAIFEKAAATNGWTTAARKKAVVAAYLRGAASDWFDTNSTTMGDNWDSRNNNTANFTDMFKTYFANDTRKNKWYQELLTLRQGSNEKVDDYATKFQRLLNRVDTGNAIPVDQKKRMFLFGLNPAITPLVHMQTANDLPTLIENARNAETGMNYTQIGPSITGVATKVSTTSTAPAKTENTQMDAIEALA
jgi:hypothetical protein